MKVTVPGKFPGMNDIVAAAKKHYACYSKMKRENTQLFSLVTRNIPKVEGQADIIFTWNFKNKRRDPDNMMAAQKFILDGLVENGVLQNDTITYIHSINHSFNLSDSDSVQIEVVPYRPQPVNSYVEVAVPSFEILPPRGSR